MVLYFTGTGNSRYVAEQIAKELDDELVSINDCLKSNKGTEFNSEKPYVFVGPIYAWRIPQFLVKFFYENTFNGSMRFYVVCTCGESSGNAYNHLVKAAIGNNVRLKGYAEIVMPNNYVMLSDVPTFEESKKNIKAQSTIISRVADYIKNEEDFVINVTSSIKNKVLSSAGYSLFQKFMVSDKGMNTDENCVLCGKCEEFCCFNNIKVSDKVTWGNNCTHCCSCISQCPNKAIQYKKVTANRKRYYLPANTEL